MQACVPGEVQSPLHGSQLDVLASSDITVLIGGETGSGKGVFARALHARSRRRSAPFITADCSTLAPSLFESLMFGHTKGSFTGAGSDRLGLVRAADGGTLFIDEVGELPLELQTKLLTLLEDQTVLPVGSEQRVRVDVRFMAATHRDLPAMVRSGEFREDLYYRLAVVETSVPPLRERIEELPDLICNLIDRKAALLKTPARQPCSQFLEVLLSYPWPGNIRELGNCIERALVLSTGDNLELHTLPPRIMTYCRSLVNPSASGSNPSQRVRRPGREDLSRALSASDGNKSAAAKQLGISRRHLYRLLDTAS